MRLLTSNKGWHSHWFYLKNDAAGPLSEFIGRLIEEALNSWKWGVLEKDKKKIQDNLATIRILKERGLKGLGIIGAYHTRRVVPLMRRRLPRERSSTPKSRSISRRRWSLRGTTRAPP